MRKLCYINVEKMKTTVLAVVLLLCGYSFNYSQVSAVKTDIKPSIDGVLEEVWTTASRFTSFKQIEPEILADATVKTEGYFLYDEENFYVAIKMYQDKNTIRSSNGRKDADIIRDGDFISFIVDPLNNYTQAFFFTVNAVNAVRDGYADESGNPFTEWDGIFYSAVNVTEGYWSVEIQVPLSTINFQDKEVQDWNVRFMRYYTQNQEVQVSELVDINNPYRLTNYSKLLGLAGLEKTFKFRITPYGYSHYDEEFLGGTNDFKGKIGGEVKYSPNSSMTILATVNPDYAQIETDKEVINVSDLPTEYPEKRPFFIESSDFYPGAAVNTRNIVDIKVGVKLRKLGDVFKYDITGVLDGDNNQWLLSNIKLSESSSYIAEVIGGIKNQKSRYDYNVTTHLLKQFFDNRLSLSNWIGTINMPGGKKNEFETVTTVNWKTRTIFTGIRAYTRSPLYNPNIVGWNYLSNEIFFKTWFQFSIINESGFFRTTNILGEYYSYDLYSHTGNNQNLVDFTLENTLHINEYLGNWFFCILYSIKTNQKFRNRNEDTFYNNLIFKDAISEFVLIEDPASSIALEVKSDFSKPVGFALNINNKHVRKSKAINIAADIYLKLSESSVIQYSLGYIKIDGSEYQRRLEQIIHRFQVEYNITDKLNIRAIVQPNIYKLPNSNNYKSNIAAYNLTLSWEYMPGSFIYFVYNNFKNTENTAISNKSVLKNNQSFILKINKSFSF